MFRTLSLEKTATGTYEGLYHCALPPIPIHPSYSPVPTPSHPDPPAHTILHPPTEQPLNSVPEYKPHVCEEVGCSERYLWKRQLQEHMKVCIIVPFSPSTHTHPFPPVPNRTHPYPPAHTILDPPTGLYLPLIPGPLYTLPPVQPAPSNHVSGGVGCSRYFCLFLALIAMIHSSSICRGWVFGTLSVEKTATRTHEGR